MRVMRAILFFEAMRDQRRRLAGWSVAMVLLVWIEAALWPTVDDMANFDELLSSYPEGFKKLFDVGSMTTGQGFMNAELYTLLLPILFVAYGIGRGARVPADEEERGLLDAVLVTPVPRWRVLVESAAGSAAGLGLLAVVLAVAILSASVVFDLGVDVEEAAAGSLVMFLLGVEFGLVATMVGSFRGRRSLAVATASAAAVAAYVTFVVGQFVDAFAGLSDLSPMDQALSTGPLGTGLQPAHIWMALVSLGCLLVACVAFSLRDIRAH